MVQPKSRTLSSPAPPTIELSDDEALPASSRQPAPSPSSPSFPPAVDPRFVQPTPSARGERRIIALYESSAHPEYHPERLARAPDVCRYVRRRARGSRWGARRATPTRWVQAHCHGTCASAGADGGVGMVMGEPANAVARLAPCSYLLLFLNEVYALFCRSMLFAHFCGNVAGRAADTDTPDGQGRRAEPWHGTQALQDALDSYACNLPTASSILLLFCFVARGIFDGRTTCTFVFTEAAMVCKGNLPGPQAGDRKIQYQNELVIRRVTLPIHPVPLRSDPRGRSVCGYVVRPPAHDMPAPVGERHRAARCATFLAPREGDDRAVALRACVPSLVPPPSLFSSFFVPLSPPLPTRADFLSLFCWQRSSGSARRRES
ncbi:hypothetical protein FB451DRAFT_1412013 [Mycena latifolia]|nr:hypothetical protein FB451DRAFT_1412013 [Mycena latifolia]